MKLTLKSSIALTALCSSLLFACKKGDTGPAGNANVTVFNYPERTISGGATDYSMPNVSQGQMDSSFVLAYYNPVPEATNAWYAVPGLGSGATYQTRFITLAANATDQIFRLRLNIPGGAAAYTTNVEFRKFRIFLVPANNFLSGRNSGPVVDHSDYKAVCAYYNIPE